MASGSFTGTTGNKHITARIVWSAISDRNSNTSDVTASLSYRKSTESTAATYGDGEFYITIDGVKSKKIEKRITLNPDNKWVEVGTFTQTVEHTNDGSKTIGISGSGGIPGLSFSTTTCFGTVTLDKIPRATVPTFGAESHTIGSNVTIWLNAADPSFHHTLT